MVCSAFYRHNARIGERDYATGIGAPRVDKVIEAVLHDLASGNF